MRCVLVMFDVDSTIISKESVRIYKVTLILTAVYLRLFRILHLTLNYFNGYIYFIAYMFITELYDLRFNIYDLQTYANFLYGLLVK